MPTYYVRPDGNNANTGLTDNAGGAWLTCAKAATTCVAGDTCYIRAGVYAEGMVFANHGTEASPITFIGEAGTEIGWAQSDKRWIVLRGVKLYGISGNDGLFSYLANAEDNLVEDCVFDRVLANYSAVNMAFNFPGVKPLRLTMRNNQFLNCTRTAELNLQGVGHLIEDNYFSAQSGQDCIRIASSYTTIRGNMFENWSRPEGSLLHTDLFQAFSSNGEIAEYNIIEGNFAINCVDCQIGNLEDQAQLGRVGNWIWRNNIFVDVDAQMSIYTPGMKFFNNVFVRCGKNGVGPVLFRDSLDRNSATGGVMRNNVFLECGNNPASTSVGWYSSTAGITDLVVSNNFVRGTGAGTVKGAGWTESGGINGLDPLFVNAAANNYQLQAGSPLIDTGYTLSVDVPTDYDGTARTGAYDIGAFSYVSSFPFLLPGTVATTELSTAGGGNFFGFWFENTSGEPIVITQLGRYQRTGNNQIHSLRVYSVTASLSPATLLGSVSVNCSGATVGTWLVGTLPSPVTIGLGVKFMICSEEFTGGDTFGNNGGTSFVTSGIGNTWSGYVLADGTAYKGTDSNRGFGPVNFWYSSPRAVWTKIGTTYVTDGLRYSVQGAHDDATPGDTIEIPTGTYLWGSGGSYLNLSKAITLKGAGTGSTTLNVQDGGGYTNGVIRISAAVVIKDMTVTQVGGGSTTTVFSINSANGWRISNIIYNSAATGVGYFVYFGTYGLIDQCVINGGAGNDEWIFGRGPADAWQNPSNKGTANATYVEDCTLKYQGYLDANANASVVVRNCTIDPAGVGAIKLDGHGTATNSPPRSFRLMECYRNQWISNNGGSNQACFEIRGGTGFFFDNTCLTGSFILGDYRITPNGPNTVGDYPLYDQVGTGQDPFPASAAGEPAYIWNNVKGGLRWSALQSLYGVSMVGLINPDRDYFENPASFDGTSGVGRGTKAAMLAITPTTAKVGYWVTDEASWDTTLPAGSSGQLYIWNGSAWVLYYTPYTYPHPLRGAVSADTTPPSPNPSTITSATVDSSTQITVVADLAVDVVSPPVEYNHSVNGVYQGWQSSQTRILTGLMPGTLYLLRVKARDAEGNETTQSAELSRTTFAATIVTEANPLGLQGSRNAYAFGAF